MQTSTYVAGQPVIAQSESIHSPWYATSQVSWGAVIAGMVMAIAIHFLLSLLGTGIGMSTIDPLNFSSPDVSTFGMSAAVWWAGSSMISLFIGGWIASHLSGTPEKTNAVLHGLVTWGLATLVSVYLVATAVSSVVKGGASVVGGAASVTATGAAAAAVPLADMAKQKMEENGISMDTISAQVKQLLQQTGKKDLQPGALSQQADEAGEQVKNGINNAGQRSGSAEQDLQAIIQRIVSSGKETVDQVDRDAVVNVVMAQAKVSKVEAEQRVDGWIKTYQETRIKFEQQKEQAEQKAREAGDATAEVTSRISLGLVIAPKTNGITRPNDIREVTSAGDATAEVTSRISLGLVIAFVLGAISAAFGGLCARRKVLVTGERI